MRYVVRIAEFSESSNLRTQNALSGYSWEHASSSVELTSVPSLTLLGSRKERLSRIRTWLYVAKEQARGSNTFYGEWRRFPWGTNAKRVCLLTIVVLSSDGASPPKISSIYWLMWSSSQTSKPAAAHILWRMAKVLFREDQR